MMANLARILVIAALAITLSGSLSAQKSASQGASTSPMPTTLTAPIYVAGYQIRTSNTKEMSGNGEIGKLWGRFMQQNLAAQIPNRTGQSLMVVYSDYASDEKGEYSYLLGAPVTSVDTLPAGLTYRRIPAGSYTVFTTPKGPLVEVLQSTWKQIWS